jgi:hypothetical protein
VKFLSRAFTALNLLPSMAATAWANRPSRRHRAMNWRQVPRIAGPLSFLKSAMVLAEHRRSRARLNQAHRQRNRSRGPDCHRLHSHPAAQGTRCSGCDPRPPQSASSTPHQIKRESYHPSRFHTAWDIMLAAITVRRNLSNTCGQTTRFAMPVSSSRVMNMTPLAEAGR